MILRDKAFNHLPDQPFFVGLLWNFSLLLVTAVVIFVVRQDWPGVWSLTLGAAVSALNFWLLSTSIPHLVRADLATAPSSRTRRIVRRALIEFLGRYVVVGGVAYLAVRSRAVHVGALAMGFSLPILAIMIQGVRLTFGGGRTKPA